MSKSNLGEVQPDERRQGGEVDPFLGFIQGSPGKKTSDESRHGLGGAQNNDTSLLARRRRTKPSACQADGCGRDLSSEKSYLQRYSVCKAHFKADVVLVAGHEVRFCQQCNKFQDVRAFEGSRRSCMARSRHRNMRRRMASGLNKAGAEDEAGARAGGSPSGRLTEDALRQKSRRKHSSSDYSEGPMDSGGMSQSQGDDGAASPRRFGAAGDGGDGTCGGTGFPAALAEAAAAAAALPDPWSAGLQSSRRIPFSGGGGDVIMNDVQATGPGGALPSLEQAVQAFSQQRGVQASTFAEGLRSRAADLLTFGGAGAGGVGAGSGDGYSWPAVGPSETSASGAVPGQNNGLNQLGIGGSASGSGLADAGLFPSRYGSTGESGMGGSGTAEWALRASAAARVLPLRDASRLQDGTPALQREKLDQQVEVRRINSLLDAAVGLQRQGVHEGSRAQAQQLHTLPLGDTQRQPLPREAVGEASAALRVEQRSALAGRATPSLSMLGTQGQQVTRLLRGNGDVTAWEAELASLAREVERSGVESWDEPAQTLLSPQQLLRSAGSRAAQQPQVQNLPSAVLARSVGAPAPAPEAARQDELAAMIQERRAALMRQQMERQQLQGSNQQQQYRYLKQEEDELLVAGSLGVPMERSRRGLPGDPLLRLLGHSTAGGGARALVPTHDEGGELHSGFPRSFSTELGVSAGTNGGHGGGGRLLGAAARAEEPITLAAAAGMSRGSGFGSARRGSLEHAHSLDAMQLLEQFVRGGGLAAGGVSGQEEALTGRVCLKIFSCMPEELPGHMLQRLRRWAMAAESDVIQVFMRPGCVHFIANVRHTGGGEAALRRSVLGAGRLEDAVAALRAAFESSGLLRGRRLVVQAAEGSRGAFEYDGSAGRDGQDQDQGPAAGAEWGPGRAAWVDDSDMARAPGVQAISPAAVTCGVATPLLLVGRNLLVPGTVLYARCNGCSYKLQLLPQPEQQDQGKHQQQQQQGAHEAQRQQHAQRQPDAQSQPHGSASEAGIVARPRTAASSPLWPPASDLRSRHQSPPSQGPSSGGLGSGAAASRIPSSSDAHPVSSYDVASAPPDSPSADDARASSGSSSFTWSQPGSSSLPAGASSSADKLSTEHLMGPHTPEEHIDPTFEGFLELSPRRDSGNSNGSAATQHRGEPRAGDTASDSLAPDGSGVDRVWVMLPALPRPGLLAVEAVHSGLDVMGAWAAGVACSDPDVADELSRWAGRAGQTSARWLVTELGVLLDYDAALANLRPSPPTEPALGAPPGRSLLPPPAPTAQAATCEHGEVPSTAVAPERADEETVTRHLSALMSVREWTEPADEPQGLQAETEAARYRAWLAQVQRACEQSSLATLATATAAADAAALAALAQAEAAVGSRSAARRRGAPSNSVPLRQALHAAYMAAARELGQPAAPTGPAVPDRNQLPPPSPAADPCMNLLDSPPVAATVPRDAGSSTLMSASGSTSTASWRTWGASLSSGASAESYRRVLGGPAVPQMLYGDSATSTSGDVGHGLSTRSRDSTASHDTRVADAIQRGRFGHASSRHRLSHPLLHPDCEASMMNGAARLLAFAVSSELPLLATGLLDWLLERQLQAVSSGTATSGSEEGALSAAGEAARMDAFKRLVDQVQAAVAAGAASPPANAEGGAGLASESGASSGDAKAAAPAVGLLHLAVAQGSAGLVVRLLDWADAAGVAWPLEERAGLARATPLHLAAALRDGGEVARLLLAAGGWAAQDAWLEARDACGRTPADIAAAGGPAHLTHFCLYGEEPLEAYSDGEEEAQEVEAPTGVVLCVGSEAPNAGGRGGEGSPAAALAAEAAAAAPSVDLPRSECGVTGKPCSPVGMEVVVSVLMLLFALLAAWFLRR